MADNFADTTIMQATQGVAGYNVGYLNWPNLLTGVVVSDKFHKSRHKRHGKLLTYIILGIIAVPIIGLVSWFFMTTQGRVEASVLNYQFHAIDKPIVVTFNKLVDGDLRFKISPVTEGNWHFSDRGLLGARQAVFVPNKPLAVATKYDVTIKGLKRVVTGDEIAPQHFQIKTELAPGVGWIKPSQNQENVSVNQPISLLLSGALTGGLNPEIKITPSTRLIPVRLGQQQFTWIPETSFVQGVKYDVNVINPNSGASIIKYSFTTTPKPSFENETKSSNFQPGDEIKLKFSQPMEITKPAINCGCAGSGSWQGNDMYIFTPTGLKPDETINYSVPKGLTSVAGGFLEEDQKFAVQTTGHVTASVSLPRSPSGSMTATINFSQSVDKASVENRISLSPQVHYDLRWVSSYKLELAVTGLQVQTGYTVSVASGIQPTGFGLPSDRSFSGSTVSAPVSIKLNVPQYYQQYGLSCEESALRMALAYYGIQVSDMQVLQAVGYPNVGYDKANNIWTDPYVSFVGSVHGAETNMTGYGVYAPPIAKAAESFGRKAEVYNGVSASFIAQQIYAGYPVVAWGSNRHGPSGYMSWTAPDGRKIQAWEGEHSRTIIGVVGSASNPVGFYVNDPDHGSSYWPTSLLERDLNSVGNLSNQIVVVK